MNLTYASFIAEERIAVGDELKYTHDVQVGDGATSILITSEQPVGTATLAVRVSGTLLTEGTLASGYTTDYQRGVITFATAVATGATITADYQRAILSNDTWLNISNDSIRDMTPQFWKEVMDTTSATSVAYLQNYTMPTGCIDLVQVYMRLSNNTSETWRTLTTHGYNWRYSRDLNQMLMGSGIVQSGYPLRLNYLSAYTLSTTSASLTTATIDVQDEFKPVLQANVRKRYWQHRLQERIALTGAVAVERTTTPLQGMLAVIAYWDNESKVQASRLKRPKPSRALNTNVRGGGTP